jgi:hypothetical protein
MPVPRSARLIVADQLADDCRASPDGGHLWTHPAVRTFFTSSRRPRGVARAANSGRRSRAPGSVPAWLRLWRPVGWRKAKRGPLKRGEVTEPRARSAVVSRFWRQCVSKNALFHCQVRVDDKNGGCLLGDRLQADRTAGRSSLWQARLVPGAIIARNCVVVVFGGSEWRP